MLFPHVVLGLFLLPAAVYGQPPFRELLLEALCSQPSCADSRSSCAKSIVAPQIFPQLLGWWSVLHAVD